MSYVAVALTLLAAGWVFRRLRGNRYVVLQQHWQLEEGKPGKVVTRKVAGPCAWEQAHTIAANKNTDALKAHIFSSAWYVVVPAKDEKYYTSYNH